MLQRFKPRRKTKEGDKVSLQTKPIFGVNKGIDLSVHPMEIEDMYLRWAENVYVKENKIRKRNGYSVWGTETPLAGDPVMEIEQFYKYDGTTYLCAFTTKNMYCYNTTTKKWDLKTEGEVVCDCESAWTASANVTSTADNTVERYGTYCAKHVIAAGFTTGLASYFNFASNDLTGYTHLYFYIRSSVVLAAGDLQIVIDNTNNCVSPLETLDVPAIPLVNTWYEFCVAFSDASALGAITSVGLNVAVDNGEVTVYIDQIYALNCMTGTVSDKSQTEQIYDDNDGETKFIYSNGVDSIKFWNGTGNWANLGGSPNKAKRLINFEHYLMLMYTYVSTAWAPQRVEWPQIGKPETWTGEDAGNNTLAASTDFIEGSEHLDNGLVIFKTNSVTTVSFLGGVDPFGFEEVKAKGQGCMAEGSIQNIGDEILYLGWDNVYSYKEESVPKGNNVVIRLIDEINQSKLNLIHSHVIENMNLYLLFVPSVNSDYPDMCWVFDYVENSWHFWRFGDYFTSSGVYSSGATLTIADLTGKISTLAFTLGSRVLKTLDPINLFGSSGGYIYKYDPYSFDDNGSAIDAYIDTKSYVFNAINLYSMLCQIALFGKGNDIEVSVSVNDGFTFVTIGTIEQNTVTELATFLRKVDRIGDRFMVRLRNNVAGEWFEITGWELEYIERARVV